MADSYRKIFQGSGSSVQQQPMVGYNKPKNKNNIGINSN